MKESQSPLQLMLMSYPTQISKNAVEQFIIEHQITAIVNCAAYTAVDKAEEDQELADKINYLAVKNFAIIEKDKGISLIHVSTDYVFEGNKKESCKKGQKAICSTDF